MERTAIEITSLNHNVPILKKKTFLCIKTHLESKHFRMIIIADNVRKADKSSGMRVSSFRNIGSSFKKNFSTR